MLELESVRRSFSGREILGPVRLRIEEGDFVSMVGPSGCGKSTLLRILAGLDESDVGGRLTSSFLPRSTGFVFQESHLMPWRTVEENVRLPLELLGRKADPGRVRELLELLGLKGFERHRPRQLSGGMKMRVSLARALMGEPRLLLLDEPFAALDEPVREALDDELLRLKREMNLTVVFVTHSVAEAVYLGSRVLVFSARPGRIIMERSPNFPSERTALLRETPEFHRETRLLSRALRAGYEEAL